MGQYSTKKKKNPWLYGLTHLHARPVSFWYPNREVLPLILSGPKLSVYSTQKGAPEGGHSYNLLSYKETTEGLI